MNGGVTRFAGQDQILLGELDWNLIQMP
jgi:hypothetical protein